MIKEFTVIAQDTYGHRKATDLVNQIKNLKSSITFKNDEIDRIVNAKSLIGVLSLVIKKGEKFTVCVFNNNEEQFFHDFVEIQKIMGVRE